MMSRAHPLPDPRTIERIAIFRALFLGDLILSVPAMRAIRRHFPNAEITLISLPWASDFAAHIRMYVDRFESFPGYPGFAEGEAPPETVQRFLRGQQARGYDIAIQMHGSGSISNPFVVQLGARLTAGLYSFELPPGLTFAQPYPDDEPEIFRNLRLASMLGCTEMDPTLDFPVLLEDTREARRLLGNAAVATRPTVVLHPGSKSPARRWPPQRFAALANLLAERLDACIVLTGSRGEAPLVDEVANAMAGPSLNLAGETTLGGLAAILSMSDIVIANDTGPAHLAEAVGTPTVTVHGPAEIGRWAPLDRTRFPIVRVPVACSPCEYIECPIDHRCMTSITPERVFATAEGLLEGGRVRCDVSTY